MLFRSQATSSFSFSFFDSSDLGMPEESPHPLEVWPIQEVIARMTLGVSFTFFAARINATTEVTEDSIRSEEHTSELQSIMRISSAVFCVTQHNRQIHTYSYQNYTNSS